MRPPPTPRKWCHVTWSTAGHRKCFNIAAQARFCEHALRAECLRQGWVAEVAVLPDRVHVLLQVPAAAPRGAIVRRLVEITAQVARQAGVPPRRGRVWERSGWCAVLTNGPALEAVRRCIHRWRQASTPAATARR